MIKGLSERFYTKKEFEEYLKEICEEKKVSVSYTVTDELENSFIYGEKAEQSSSQCKIIHLENGYCVRTEIWENERQVKIEDYEELFREYWNKKLSDEITGFPTTGQSSTLDKCNKTLEYYYENNQSVALIVIDLDHFKEVNDKYDHEIGDTVLGEFSQLLFSAFFDYGIVLHQSGDEFNVIFPYNNIVDIVDIVKQAHDKIKNHTFTCAQEIDLSMAVGIKCIKNELLSYTEARTMAEKAYNSKEKNSSKQRDSIRIDGEKSRVVDAVKDLKLAWTRLICNLDCMISGNVYLEFIKKHSENCDGIKEFQKQIDDIVDWINPDWNDSTAGIRYNSKNVLVDTTEKISHLEVCLAVTQGLLKNPLLLEK